MEAPHLSSNTVALLPQMRHKKFRNLGACSPDLAPRHSSWRAAPRTSAHRRYSPASIGSRNLAVLQSCNRSWKGSEWGTSRSTFPRHCSGSDQPILRRDQMAKRNIAPKPIRPLSQKDIDRFWSKVDRRGPDECWPWLGGKTSDGYGRFKYGRCEYKAIRVAYYLQTGKLPDTGMSILHSCDFPACQNAAHLREGTTRENMKDRDERGRTAKGDRSGSRLHPQSSIFVTRNPQKLNPPIGSKHPRATLTEKDIPPIRNR